MDQEGGASIPGEPSGEDTSRREEAGFGGRDGHFMGEGIAVPCEGGEVQPLGRLEGDRLEDHGPEIKHAGDA